MKARFVVLMVGSLVFFLTLRGAANAANPSCADCVAFERAVYGQPIADSKIEDSYNVASMLAYPVSGFSGSAVMYPVMPRYDDGWVNYRGGLDDLPGAFKAPWELTTTNFDPSFKAPYWSMETGPKNVASAPWNSYLSYSATGYRMGIREIGVSPAQPILRWSTPQAGGALD